MKTAVIRNRYDRSELAGAFGDLGTFLPFVIGYIAILNIDPSGILLSFGVFLIASGLYYKTPFPVQPMKAIGGAAITQAGLITPNMIWGAGLFSGLFWLIIGMSGTLKYVSKVVGKPVLRGIILGLGISFIMQGLDLIRLDVAVGVAALIMALGLMSNKRFPAMFALLIVGLAVTLVRSPELWGELVLIRPYFRLPDVILGTLTWNELLTGIFILAIPQIPLTLGNAVVAATAENNRLFPDRPVSEKKVAITKGIMNILSPIFGGIPVCHGAGGLAAHVRFGASTGGAVVILGSLLLALGLFFSNSVLFLFGLIPSAVLGVILFFAGLELAMSARDVGPEKSDYYILFVTAGFSLWNVGVGFLAGLIVYQLVTRGLFRV